MIVSPAPRREASASTVDSVISPAGTMIQARRGASSFATKSSSESDPIAPSCDERRDGLGAHVVDDARVTVAHESPDDVRTHPAKTDHPELHARSLYARSHGQSRPDERGVPNRPSRGLERGAER